MSTFLTASSQSFVSSGPVVARLAGMANERDREREFTVAAAGPLPVLYAWRSRLGRRARATPLAAPTLERWSTSTASQSATAP